MKRRQFIAMSAIASTCRSSAKAAEGPEPLVSFGLMTDVQYADADPQGERHYRESLPKLRQAVAELSKAELPFTLHLGDVIDRGFSSFGEVLPLFEPLGHPVRHLLGNHDFDVPDERKTEVPRLLGMAADHYSFTASGVCFIMLDTNDVSTYKHAAGSPALHAARETMEKLASTRAKNAQPWNGGISTAQLDWLEKELAAADSADQPAIVCSHHPLLPEEGHQAWNNGDVLTVIRRHRCVRACFYGHNHAGNQVLDGGIPHITFKSVLHEPGVTAWSIVRLYRDKLVIEGRGREATREIGLQAS